MPSAYLCGAIKAPHDAFSHDSVIPRRPPAISSTAVYARPPDLPPAPLMDMGFAISCSLARCRRPPIRFLSIGKGNQAVVRDGHTMGVAAEILHDVFGATEGALQVHHPMLSKQGP